MYDDTIVNSASLVKEKRLVYGKKVRCMFAPMLLAKKVRESAGLNPWAMHKKMGKKSVQAYLSLERSAKRISLEDFFILERIYIEHGCGSAGEFYELAKKLSKGKK